jgi:hypothetical protein
MQVLKASTFGLLLLLLPFAVGRADTWAQDCQTPLILDLENSGAIELSSLVDPVMFDLSGDGRKDLVAWTERGHADGFLWIDLNHNRVVDGGNELFGNATTLILTGARGVNGFAALAQYDRPELGGNDDGMISGADAVWGQLRLWIDRNHDAVMQTDESHSLASLAIVSIDLHYVFTSFELDGHANGHAYRSTFSRRVQGTGTTERLLIEDVALRVQH